MARPKPETVKSLRIDVVAELLRVTPRRIRFMFEEGKLAKAEDGQVSIASLAAHLAVKDAQPDDYEANRARKMKADAELSEIAVERERGRLFDAARTKKAWEGVVMHARAKLLGLPERIGQQVLTAPDVAAAKKILAKEINETLDALAECRVEAEPDVLTPEPEAESETTENEEAETDDAQPKD